MFLTINFTNWNVINKYFRMSFLNSVSAKNDFLSLYRGLVNRGFLYYLIYQ